MREDYKNGIMEALSLIPDSHSRFLRQVLIILLLHLKKGGAE